MPLLREQGQKPWSFRAIEVLNYCQIGVALILIGSGSLALISHVLRNRTLGQILRPISSLFWSFLDILGDTLNQGGPYEVLGIVTFFLFQMFISSVVLFTLNTKSLKVVRGTAVIALFLRILVGLESVVAYFSDGYSIVFILGSILTVVFLFLNPVKRYIRFPE